ncbi:uncharacterized protein LOC106154955 isoform X3 [Lingula anatina]|uniref:Uncharacterized protein LOC106154955 isoform X3 n=1 Tax=Lingula anatina TaxID=7574 RepID=A0A1S3HG01_LINAN|nr:uncharacterized protein LOC106154955 isoform X3 [Lingula anatina]|eukprot:XP_013384982.1 uncharacterized protein LOC106154955 isoform X3 [Lingula anatina]
MEEIIQEHIKHFQENFSQQFNHLSHQWISCQLLQICCQRFNNQPQQFQHYLEETGKLLQSMKTEFGVSEPGTLSLKFVFADKRDKLCIKSSSIPKEEWKEAFKSIYYAKLRKDANYPHPQDLFLKCLAIDMETMLPTEISVNELEKYQEKSCDDGTKKKKLSVTLSIDIEEQEGGGEEANSATLVGDAVLSQKNDRDRKQRKLGLSVEESEGLEKVGTSDTGSPRTDDLTELRKGAEIHGVENTEKPSPESDNEIGKSVTPQLASLQLGSQLPSGELPGGEATPGPSSGELAMPTVTNPAYPPPKRAVRQLSEQESSQGPEAVNHPHQNPGYPPTKQAIKEICGDNRGEDAGIGMENTEQPLSKSDIQNLQKNIRSAEGESSQLDAQQSASNLPSGKLAGVDTTDDPSTEGLAVPTSTNPAYPPPKHAVRQLSEQESSQGPEAVSHPRQNPGYPPTKQAIKEIHGDNCNLASSAASPDNTAIQMQENTGNNMEEVKNPVTQVAVEQPITSKPDADQTIRKEVD